MDNNSLMDQNDPEKRITDLEHQLAEQQRGADLPPAQPPQLANAAGGTGSVVPKPAPMGIRTWIGVAFVVVYFGGPALYWLGVVLLPSYYNYWVGTPTTATIDHCVSGTRSETCYGRWSVGGVSQTGWFPGTVEDLPVGSQVDVHVRGGTAYTAYWASPSYWTVFLACYVIAFGFGVPWSVWRRHKTGSWPWSGRRFKFFGLSGPPNRTQPT
jgi:hypothetical protein